jgi:hypothetical protein
VEGGGEGVGGESDARTALTLPELPEDNLRTRSRSAFSREGVGEFRADAKSSFLRRASRRLRILWMTIVSWHMDEIHFSIVRRSSSSKRSADASVCPDSIDVIGSRRASSMIIDVS